MASCCAARLDVDQHRVESPSKELQFNTNAGKLPLYITGMVSCLRLRDGYGREGDMRDVSLGRFYVPSSSRPSSITWVFHFIVQWCLTY